MHPLKHLLTDSELLLNAVGEGIYGFDLDGNAVFINPAAERMTGWPSDEIIGKKIHQYHHHSHENGEHYPAENCHIYATMRDGRTRHIANEVFWRKDGTSFPVEYTSTPVYKNNKLIGAVAVFRDISQQKQTDKALREALQQVQLLSNRLEAENNYLKAEINENWQDSGLVGQTAIFRHMLEQIDLVGQTDSTVLIQGENGTGKELVARSIHRNSRRAKSPIVSINCAAFSENLLESELFGHEKGAFTGAAEKRLGRFELADRGTIFLDEIGELSLEAQSKLLRVLQEQEFERVGGNKTIKVNIRIIAATNRDLLTMVNEGKFRMDLYYRLNVFPINVPALRERLEDIPLLCQTIIHRLNKKLGKHIAGINQASIQLLSQYHWPGNIRELQNILEREMILATKSVLTVKQKLTANTNKMKLQSLAEAERLFITETLVSTNWKIGGSTGAAAILDLPESTLRSKMKKLNINRP